MKRILAIDDQKYILKLIKAALNGVGYEVRTTSDAATFFKLLRAEKFDLAILDVIMPDKHGFDLFKELRACKPLPVLFVTGYPKAFDPSRKGFAELWENEFFKGDTDVLYKPFQLEALFEKVEGLIGTAAETNSE